MKKKNKRIKVKNKKNLKNKLVLKANMKIMNLYLMKIIKLLLMTMG